MSFQYDLAEALKLGRPAVNYTETQVASNIASLAGGLSALSVDTTLAEGVDLILGTSTGSQIGTAVGQKLGFHGATPVVQRAGAAQTAVVGTASTQTTPWGYATQAQADAIVTLVNEIRAALVEKGIIKGAA